MARIWADQPFQLLPIPGQPGAPSSENPGAQYMAWDMANAHNGLIRLLNAIYLQCENVQKPEDIADMVFFIKCWGDDMTHHHHGEETYLFPQLEALAKEGGIEGSVMNTNIAQHGVFAEGLEHLRNYIAEVQEGRKVYNGKVVKAHINNFAPALTEHLHDEIKSLLSLEMIDGDKLKKVFKELVNKLVKGADMNTVVPMALGSFDKTQPGCENFPLVPFFLPYLSAYWLSRKHRGAWRFCPCDEWGQPRPLQFLSPEQQ
ncbi:hypothetical protein K458DRAFT_443755 [Lentithecium fluviatile CBS 122367]|uniref:Hemerythrin-like domain-containing protein n=1 Tax=Lentithecium fluviatile CBS 122367 TaxID=1168545 RepID=A0A6G1IY15_9PLEO|nr:hypothetical protein K458DRAFT_443755 [Lentithecium fluviatile CBS 122367]